MSFLRLRYLDLSSNKITSIKPFNKIRKFNDKFDDKLDKKSIFLS